MNELWHVPVAVITNKNNINDFKSLKRKHYNFRITVLILKVLDMNNLSRDV